MTAHYAAAAPTAHAAALAAFIGGALLIRWQWKRDHEPALCGDETCEEH